VFGTCSQGTSNYPSSGGADASLNETYAQDTSWPNLNGVFLASNDTSSPSATVNTSLPSVLVNTLPSSTLTKSSSSSSFLSYSFSSQDPHGSASYAKTCKDTFTPQFKGKCDFSWYCTGQYCPDPNFFSQTFDILTLSVQYQTETPDATQIQTPDADTSFATTSVQNPFQFFYSGTCPANTFNKVLTINKLNTTVSPANQASGYTSCSCGKADSPFYNGNFNSYDTFKLVNPNDKIYTRENLTLDVYGAYFTSAGSTYYASDGTATCTNLVGKQCPNSNLGVELVLYANFRDGLTRPYYKNGSSSCGDPVTCVNQYLSDHSVIYCANQFQDFGSNRPIVMSAFPKMTHVSLTEPKPPSCKYMMDYTGNATRGLFLNIQLPSSPPNINFAQTVKYGSATYLKSFNIIGRFPGILPTLPANLSSLKASPEVVDLSTDVFSHLGAVLPDQAGNWHFGVTRHLGGQNAGSTYNTTQSPVYILDTFTSDSDFTNWPDMQTVRRVGKTNLYETDIVVRVVFYNPNLLDPTGLNPNQATNSNLGKSKTGTSIPPFSVYVPTIIPLEYTSITNFNDQALNVMTQNTPDFKSQMCNLLFVKAFERGVMMVEFVTTIAYSLMYGFALGDNLNQQRMPYFGVNQVYTKSGPYSAPDLLKHLYFYMQKVNTKNANTPTLFNLTNESKSSPQDEVTAWLAELQNHTSAYLSYPVFSWDGINEKLYVTLWMHPAMHAHLQGYLLMLASYSMDALLAVMLRSFFQDISPGPSDLEAANVMGIDSNMLTNSFTILTNNLSYTESPLVLSGATQVPSKNFVLNSAKTLSPPRTYVASYAYTAQVTDLCVGSVFYMLGNSTTFGLDQAWPQIYTTSKSKLGGVLTKLSVFAPTILASLLPSTTVKDCLASNSKTSTCLSTLCADSTHCLCDYSVWIAGLTPDPTPQVNAFVNNALSTCSCLASDSYPRAYNTKRAGNQVSRAFAFACQDFPNPPYVQACDQLEQALVTMKVTHPSLWYTLYSGKASPTSPTQDFSGLTDAYKIVSVCNLQGIKPEGQFDNDVFKLNYKVLAASIVLFLAPIVGILAWCVYNKRKITNVKVILGLAALCLVIGVVSVLLVYALSGQRSCAKVDLDESASASCVDRLSNKVVLSDNMCGQVRFCQCDVANQQCFKDAKVKNTATCTSEGVCSFCPNLTSFAVTTSLSDMTTCPTDLAYLGVAAWCFAASMLGTLWICLASSKRLSKLTTWSVFCALLVFMLGLAGLGVYLAIRTQKQNTTSIDLGQQDAAADQDNPCGS